jgi:hypothetical protein
MEWYERNGKEIFLGMDMNPKHGHGCGHYDIPIYE